MYTTLSGQIAAARQVDMIANNVANVNTTGFKAERPLFEKALNDQNKLLTSSLRKDVREPNPFPTDEFPTIKGSYSNLDQGPIESTGNPLDAAIEGPGFFVISTPAGERYTRAGNFKLDSTNRLCTQDGAPIQGQGGDITVGAGELSFGSDGTVRVNGKGIGKLRIVELDPKNISREANQLFSSSAGAKDSEKYSVVGGAIEGSNVNAVRELADLILASRLFEGLKSVQDTTSRINQARNERLGSLQG